MIEMMMREINVIRAKVARLDGRVRREVPPGSPVAGTGEPWIDKYCGFANLDKQACMTNNCEAHGRSASQVVLKTNQTPVLSPREFNSSSSAKDPIGLVRYART